MSFAIINNERKLPINFGDYNYRKGFDRTRNRVINNTLTLQIPHYGIRNSILDIRKPQSYIKYPMNTREDPNAGGDDGFSSISGGTPTPTMPGMVSSIPGIVPALPRLDEREEFEFKEQLNPHGRGGSNKRQGGRKKRGRLHRQKRMQRVHQNKKIQGLQPNRKPVPHNLLGHAHTAPSNYSSSYLSPNILFGGQLSNRVGGHASARHSTTPSFHGLAHVNHSSGLESDVYLSGRMNHLPEPPADEKKQDQSQPVIHQSYVPIVKPVKQIAKKRKARLQYYEEMKKKRQQKKRKAKTYAKVYKYFGEKEEREIKEKEQIRVIDPDVDPQLSDILYQSQEKEQTPIGPSHPKFHDSGLSSAFKVATADESVDLFDTEEETGDISEIVIIRHDDPVPQPLKKQDVEDKYSSDENQRIEKEADEELKEAGDEMNQYIKDVQAAYAEDHGPGQKIVSTDSEQDINLIKEAMNFEKFDQSLHGSDNVISDSQVKELYSDQLESEKENLIHDNSPLPKDMSVDAAYIESNDDNIESNKIHGNISGWVDDIEESFQRSPVYQKLLRNKNKIVVGFGIMLSKYLEWYANHRHNLFTKNNNTVKLNFNSMINTNRMFNYDAIHNKEYDINYLTSIDHNLMYPILIALWDIAIHPPSNQQQAVKGALDSKTLWDNVFEIESHGTGLIVYLFINRFYRFIIPSNGTGIFIQTARGYKKELIDKFFMYIKLIETENHQQFNFMNGVFDDMAVSDKVVEQQLEEEFNNLFDDNEDDNVDQYIKDNNNGNVNISDSTNVKYNESENQNNKLKNDLINANNNKAQEEKKQIFIPESTNIMNNINYLQTDCFLTTSTIDYWDQPFIEKNYYNVTQLNKACNTLNFKGVKQININVWLAASKQRFDKLNTHNQTLLDDIKSDDEKIKFERYMHHYQTLYKCKKQMVNTFAKLKFILLNLHSNKPKVVEYFQVPFIFIMCNMDHWMKLYNLLIKSDQSSASLLSTWKTFQFQPITDKIYTVYMDNASQVNKRYFFQQMLGGEADNYINYTSKHIKRNSLNIKFLMTIHHRYNTLGKKYIDHIIKQARKKGIQPDPKPEGVAEEKKYPEPDPKPEGPPQEQKPNPELEGLEEDVEKHIQLGVSEADLDIIIAKDPMHRTSDEREVYDRYQDLLVQEVKQETKLKQKRSPYEKKSVYKAEIKDRPKEISKEEKQSVQQQQKMQEILKSREKPSNSYQVEKRKLDIDIKSTKDALDSVKNPNSYGGLKKRKAILEFEIKKAEVSYEAQLSSQELVENYNINPAIKEEKDRNAKSMENYRDDNEEKDDKLREELLQSRNNQFGKDYADLWYQINNKYLKQIEAAEKELKDFEKITREKHKRYRMSYMKKHGIAPPDSTTIPDKKAELALIHKRKETNEKIAKLYKQAVPVKVNLGQYWRPDWQDFHPTLKLWKRHTTGKNQQHSIQGQIKSNDAQLKAEIKRLKNVKQQNIKDIKANHKEEIKNMRDLSQKWYDRLDNLNYDLDEVNKKLSSFL